MPNVIDGLLPLPPHLVHTVNSCSTTPKPDDSTADSAPAVEKDTSTNISELAGGSDVGQNFAKRIVAEILDRSVAKYRDSLVVDGKVEGGEASGVGAGSGESGGPKSNYVNYDIAQSVLARDAGKEEPQSEEENEEHKRNGSRTPTGVNTQCSQIYMYMYSVYYTYMYMTVCMGLLRTLLQKLLVWLVAEMKMKFHFLRLLPLHPTL